jgi:hypothetical protein
MLMQNIINVMGQYPQYAIEVFPFHSEAISVHEFLPFPATTVQIPDHVLRGQPSASGGVDMKSFHLTYSHHEA